jgi:UDP:flavonoid glycosyltransferase YjiC (YdhE family)
MLGSRSEEPSIMRAQSSCPPSGERRAKVLLGWELGGGLGHVTRLAALAQRLLDHGAETLVALRPGTETGQVFAAARRYATRFRLIPAPAVDPRGDGTPGIAHKQTLADALTGFGYDRPEPIFAAADLWNSILVRFRPDVVISDSAPSLNLTVAGRIPLVCVGSPFLTPPRGHLLPHLRYSIQHVSARARRREQRVLDAINIIRRANRLPAYAFCADVLHGDRTFVAAPPGLDPHSWDTSRKHVEPFNLQFVGALPAITADVYCYLPSLAEVGLRLAGEITDLSRSCAAFLGQNLDPPPSRDGLTVLPRPADLTSQLATTRLFVHKGGLASTWAALQTGTPQLILPPGIEMANNAALAAQLSPIVVIQDPRDAAVTAELLATMSEHGPPHAACGGLGHTCSIEALIEDVVALADRR